jgi:hypothetical protein
MWLLIAAGVDWAKEETTGLLRERRRPKKKPQARHRPRRYDDFWLPGIYDSDGDLIGFPDDGSVIYESDDADDVDDLPSCFHQMQTPWTRAVAKNNLDAVLAMCGVLDSDVLPTPRDLLQIAVAAQPSSVRSVWWADHLEQFVDLRKIGELPVPMQHWLFSRCRIGIDGVADLIQNVQRQVGFFKARAFEVCVGLQSLNLSALETCEILEYVFAPLESLVPLHLAWRVVSAVKHLRPRRFRTLPKRRTSSADVSLLSRFREVWTTREAALWIGRVDFAWNECGARDNMRADGLLCTDRRYNGWVWNESEEGWAHQELSTTRDQSSDHDDSQNLSSSDESSLESLLTEREVSAETESETQQNGADTDESSPVFENAASDSEESESPIEDVLWTDETLRTDESLRTDGSPLLLPPSPRPRARRPRVRRPPPRVLSKMEMWLASLSMVPFSDWWPLWVAERHNFYPPEPPPPPPPPRPRFRLGAVSLSESSIASESESLESTEAEMRDKFTMKYF